MAALLALSGCGAGFRPGPIRERSRALDKQSLYNGCGTALVSLTNAGRVRQRHRAGRLPSLTRSNGTVVQTVPAVSPVEFTQRVNLSEILSADHAPGSCTCAQLTLDYSQADIVVSTANGNVTVPAADLIDGVTGNPIRGQLTITRSFPNPPLVITEGTVANLALDFNLSASNTVALNAAPITVTVNPVLSATPAPDTNKLVHLRGPLLSVSAARSDYVVEVWPCEDKDERFGEFTVDATSSTTVLISGTSDTGSAGHTALAALPTHTLTTAYGAWDTRTKTFTASTVISLAQARAKLQAFRSAPRTLTAFTALSSTELIIGQAALQAATVRAIRVADTEVDASSLSARVTRVPASTSTRSGESGMSGSDDSDQAYVIAHQSSETVDTFATFSEFTTALNADLANASAIGVATEGTNGTITVQHVFVVLND